MSLSATFLCSEGLRSDLVVSVLIIPVRKPGARCKDRVEECKRRFLTCLPEPVQVIYRSSLERQMPNWRAVFQKLFKTVELSEPMYQSVVMLYRKKVRHVPWHARLCSGASPAADPRGVAAPLFREASEATIGCAPQSHGVGLRPDAFQHA